MACTVASLLTQTQERLAKYIAAEAAILGGAQSYSIGNRTLTRADLDHIYDRITKLTSQCLTLQRGNRIKSQRIVPRDDV